MRHFAQVCNLLLKIIMYVCACKEELLIQNPMLHINSII